MTIIQAVAIGLLTGTMGTTGLFLWLQSKEDPTQTIIENQAKTLEQIVTLHSKVDEGKLDIQKNLTSTDLLNVSCSSEWMSKHGPLLCREMFCRLQTREGDGASQTECEQVANLANSLTMIEQCQVLKVELKECVEIIGKRK